MSRLADEERTVMTYDELTRLRWTQTSPEQPGRALRTLTGFPDSWQQGRTLFGGAAAAAGVAAMQALVATDRAIRSVHTTFVGPIAPGELGVNTTTVRAGRGASQLRADVLQGGEVRTLVSAVFTRARPSALPVITPSCPRLRAPQACAPFPYLPGVTPEFTTHFDLRWAQGGMPFSASSERHLAGWCRHRTAAADPATALLGLIDAWPCPALALLDRPAPASSLSWSVTFVDLPERMESGAWWAFRSDVTSLRDGVAHMRGALHRADGQLVALSEQVVAVYG